MTPENRAPEAVLGRFRPGTSGNPGGRPKWRRRVERKLQSHVGEAIETLLSVMREGEPKDRVAAAKVILDFTVPKPKAGGDAKGDSKAAPLNPTLAAKLAALDS